MAEVNKILKDAEESPEEASKSKDDKPEPKHKSLKMTKRVKGEFNGFMDFVREQGVVGLAVGLTLGTAVTVFVKSIVDNIINPIIGALLPGSSDLNTKYVCLHSVNGMCTNKLGWGAVASNFISFLIIATLVYAAVHMLKLDKLDKKKDK